MEIGLFLHTHGLVRRAGGAPRWTSIGAEAMRLDEVIDLAERLGFASVWLADHVVTTRREYDADRELAEDERMRPAGCVMLDSPAVMAFIAARTRRVRIGASVLVAAYRHPLVAAQQLATIDVLSGGRLSVRVGAGWLKSEFDALGLAHHERFGVADETLEILDRVWREPWVTHRGRYFDFEDVAVEPKPVQQPRVPLLYGGSTPAAARRAARRCDGLAPRLAQEAEDPAARLDVLRAELAGEATRVGRDPASLQLVSQASCDLDDPGVGDGTPFLHGPPAKLLEDLAELAAHGCSHCTLRVDVATGTVGEYLEQVQRLGETVVPDAARVPVAPLAL